MSIRGVVWFLGGFAFVVVLGLLAGCSASGAYSPAHVAYCGMERCDGRGMR